MARMQGITGKLSGKMGAAVFRVRDGQQVVTQYNPIVKNPNTEGQQGQRAKFKLITQLSAIMAPAFGTMSIAQSAVKGKATQRNAFTKLNLPLVEISNTPDGDAAVIRMDKLQLTSSFRQFGNMSVAPDSGELQVKIRDVGDDVSTGRVILVGYGSMVPTKQATIVSMQDVPVANGTITADFSNLATGEYTVLAFGLIPSQSAASRVDFSQIYTPANEGWISAVLLNQMVQEGSMVETVTIGTNVTVGS